MEHVVSTCCVPLMVQAEWGAMLDEAQPLVGCRHLGRLSGWWVDPDTRISEPGAERAGGLPGGGWPSRVSKT